MNTKREREDIKAVQEQMRTVAKDLVEKFGLPQHEAQQRLQTAALDCIKTISDKTRTYHLQVQVSDKGDVRMIATVAGDA